MQRAPGRRYFELRGNRSRLGLAQWKSGKTRGLFLVALLNSLENKKRTRDRDYERGVFDGRFLDREGYRRRIAAERRHS